MFWTFPGRTPLVGGLALAGVAGFAGGGLRQHGATKGNHSMPTLQCLS